MSPWSKAAIGVAIMMTPAGAVSARAADAGAPARLEAVRVIADGADVRLEIDLTRPVDPKLFTLPAPKARVVLDLPARVGPGLGGAEAGAGPGVGSVLGYRFAARENGARLVLDLAQPIRPGALTIDVVSDALARLSLTLPGAAAPAAVPTAADPAPIAASLPVKVQTAPQMRRVVVIDPGHGGKDPGAVGVSGVYEKDVNLAAGLALRTELERRGYHVVMTREGDQFLELAERLRIARQAAGDLFISLHADAAQNRETAGASVYTLSERGGARAKTLAHSQNWDIDLAQGAQSASVDQILLDLTQRDTKNRSADFAQAAIRRLSPVAPLLRNTHRNAGFFVLLAPDVPAILLEMGFMTSAVDEARLTDVKSRAGMARALGEAVDEFFSGAADMASARGAAYMAR
jgi:N-acetylmuramoyl-L-alanine amidase